MTFTARPIAPFSADILSVGNPSSYTAGQQIPVTGTPSKTNATVSSGQFTLPAGSHWRIELSVNFLGDPVTGSAAFEFQFYSVTDSAYIGQSGWGSGNSTAGDSRKGRVCCTALVLNSEITTSKTIEARLISSIDTADGAAYIGTNNLRIMELPA